MTESMDAEFLALSFNRTRHTIQPSIQSQALIGLGPGIGKSKDPSSLPIE